jgi:hypothetical protein
MKTSTKYIILITVLFFISIYLIIQNKQNTRNETITISTRDYLFNSFLSELPSINSKLPFQVDANTVLLSINNENAKIISQYEIIKHNKTNNLTSEYIKNLSDLIKKQECLNDVKKRLINADIEFINRYQNQNKVILFEVAINKPICEKFQNTLNNELK